MNEPNPLSGQAPPKYSVVVPFYNEEENALPLLAEIAAAMSGLGTWEVIAVDDCSSDRTAGVLTRACGIYPDTLIALSHSVNRGQSAALGTGAARARGEWVITLDGDGQNDPADIPALLALVAEPGAARVPDLICGCRRQRRDTGLRRLSSWIANGVRSRLLADETPDTGCGLKVIRRTAWEQLPRFDHMHRFLPALVRRNGGTTVSIPVSHRPRLHGRSSYGVWNRLGVGVIDLLGVMWLNRRALAPDEIRELSRR